MSSADWIVDQNWVRDSESPCVSLGPQGDFDDMHIFAPCVACENGVYRMWYCGSRDDVAERVFRLGLAESADGVSFTRRPEPALAFPDGRTSILTPALLRGEDGAVVREGGRLRMWFSATDFPSADGVHTLHESTSEDGVSWTEPSPAQIEGIYAPSIVFHGGLYRLWFTDVTAEPWCFRYAESSDGRKWDVAQDPVMVIDQAWETSRLFYPYVIRTGGRWAMWYGAYRTGVPGMQTALGCALSDDGLRWRKLDDNPVFGPDPSRAWESHYTTSECVLRQPDGRWRMWYATRPAPPFVHKYYAIGTAVLGPSA